MVPVLFTAHNGVVLFRLRPVSDWVAHEARRAINLEGLAVPFDTRAFDLWLAAYEQLRDAIIHASNQRRLSAPTPPRAA